MTLKRYLIESGLSHWNTEIQDFKIEINDSSIHDMVLRVMNRTNLSLSKFDDKLKKGVSLMIHKVQKNKIPSKTMVSLEYLKSEFKVLFLVNPQEKYIRISSVLDNSMLVKGTVKWNINEFQETFWKLDERYLDNKHCIIFDDDTLNEGTTFMLEPNESTGLPDIFLEDNILEIEIDE